MRAGDGNGTPAEQAEMLRRADVVRRYVSIDRPSAQEDRAHAEELGLSVDSLFRLAAAWRLHGEKLAMRGTHAARPRRDDPAWAEILAEMVDVDGVHPSRQEETLRRIRVIQAYLAIDDPRPEDRTAAAAEIGVTPNRFSALTREWSLHRDPSKMPGAKPGRRRWGFRDRRRDRVHDLLRSVFSETPEASVAAMHERHVAACAAEELKPLGLAQTYAVVAKLRRARDQSLATSSSPT